MIRIIFFLFLLSTSTLWSQSFVKEDVNLKVKQNLMASDIPKVLLDAFANGDIQPYYPKNLKIKVPYAQFLYHFGMEEKANLQLIKEVPSWFCQKKKPVLVDDYAKNCFRKRLEIVSKMERNNITYQQEQKLVYVQIFYSGECVSDGVETPGPIFMIKDISKLRKGIYKITNPANSAVNYTILELLQLKLYSGR